MVEATRSTGCGRWRSSVEPTYGTSARRFPGGCSAAILPSVNDTHFDNDSGSVEPSEATGGHTDWGEFDLFRGIGPGVLQEILASMDVGDVPDGVEILEQGSVGSDMFLIEEGTVRVVIVDEAADGAVRFSKELAAPTIVGEMALITKEPRNATVIAVGPVKVRRISKKDFRAIVMRHPAAASVLTRAVGNRLMDGKSIRQVGKYKILGRLGKGGMATVFEAVHPTLDQTVALKMLSHTFVLNRGFTDVFEREARILAKLDHPNIVRVMDTELAYGTNFIVMERLQGRGLEEVAVAETRLAWDHLRRMLRDLCDALHHCHDRGLLHRDVKPSNIFLCDDGKAKLMDFNIAYGPETPRILLEQMTGTPNFMAPEQVRGDTLDGRTDLYSLGVTAYALVVGEAPYLGDTVQEVLDQHLTAPMPDPRDRVPTCPGDIARFIAAATAKDPNHRYPDCAAAVAYFDELAELPIVGKLSLTTLAVSCHPSREDFVKRLVRRFVEELDEIPGVSVAVGGQAAPKTRQRKNVEETIQ